MLDMAVNMGSTIANRFLQESYNAISSGQIVVDGISGSITIDAINKIPEDKIEILLECIRVLQKNHYLQIVKKRLDQQKFLKGWLKRANQ